MNTNNGRIAWVDVLRFLGIWAIYIGHFGEKAGRTYPFVFAYHVPLFFFAAGFFSARYQKDTPLVFIKKKTQQLMIPYAVFSLMALIVFTLQNDWDILQVMDASMGFILGIRDQIIAGSLWFIPCLYLITILDYFVRRLLISQWAVLAVSIGAFLISQTILPNNPATDPSWFMNLDSALFYYVYYALGSLLFPQINREETSASHRVGTVVLITFAFTVTVISYFLTSHWFLGKIATIFPFIKTTKLAVSFFTMIMALIIIYCNITVAKLLAHITFLKELGQETLVFCLSEDIIKILITLLLAAINLKVRLINPLVTISFSLICLIISKYTLVKFLSAYFPWAVGKPASSHPA